MSYYIGLADLYFKLAVRGPFPYDEILMEWYKTTIKWIETLNIEDKVLLLKVYSHWDITVNPDEYERVKLLAAQFARDMKFR